ncbi:hypothetical protein C0Q70_17061 [Pomacea canaliculata]|uniref:Prolyl 4-hydroxylase alpha subunit domain-containing protein n=2 Tax=Pomacea canaliculata TaxID=400727 RepID=A0A2T7NRJ2_POMCA|nr:hypothetical protein C0Q70_17061 [Pomacea canaliculata]
MSTSPNETDESSPKRFKGSNTISINQNYVQDALKNILRKEFQAGSGFKDDVTGAEVQCTPFRHVSLPCFIHDDQFVSDLITELEGLDMVDKSNDLYKFKQSMELKHAKTPSIKAFRKMLQDQMLPWLKDITCHPLNDRIDLFCSLYQYTDVLLCHDDELEERYIAFIYYLVPKLWSEEDGGLLDLFDVDEHGQPKDIVKSIIPLQNMFVFFEVTPSSFHQVSEILTQEKSRFAISGWFHGPPVSRPASHREPRIPLFPCTSIEEEGFLDWINPIYLSPEIQADIRERFENESEIELSEFIKEEKYEELAAAIQCNSVPWRHHGPPNKRSYDTCRMEDLPPEAATVMKMMQSDAMFLLLSTLTGLQLHELAADSDEEKGASSSAANGNSGKASPAKCRTEAQRWQHGDYTLIHDTDIHGTESALDACLYIGCEDWSMAAGGYTSYVAREEDEELLTVCPSPNSLALVYRDKETLRFVKHINHQATLAKSSRYYSMYAVYYEKPE